MQLLLHTPVGEMDLELKITGEFNVYNVMGVIGAMLAENIDKDYHLAPYSTVLTASLDVSSLLRQDSLILLL